MMERDYFRRGVAEFVGTFALIFVAAGAAVFALTPTDAALANGLVIAVMVSAVGFISGGHINPAVTLGFLVTRRIAPKLAVWYWIAQFGGAALAALLVRDLLPRATTEAVKLGVPALGHGVDAAAGMGLEAILTFFLAWVVFASAVDARGTFKSIAEGVNKEELSSDGSHFTATGIITDYDATGNVISVGCVTHAARRLSALDN